MPLSTTRGRPVTHRCRYSDHVDDDVATPAEEPIDDQIDDQIDDPIDDPIADDVDDADEVEEVDEDVDLEPISPANPDYIRTAQRRYGGIGAVMAAGMFGLEQAMGIKPKPESVQIQEAPSDPIDVDKDGIQMTIDATTSVHAPALDRRSPIGINKKRSRRG